MLVIINMLRNLNYFICVFFISAIKIKYLGKLHLPLSSSLPNSVKYSAKNCKCRDFFLSLKWMFCHQNIASHNPK